MVAVMSRGFSDLAIVVVKRKADEDAVTYLRIKLSGSGPKWPEAKGGTC